MESIKKSVDTFENAGKLSGNKRIEKVGDI